MFYRFVLHLLLLKAFCDLRFKYYHKRKQFIVKDLNNQLLVLHSKLKFIQHIISNKLKVKDLTKSQITEYLSKNDGFIMVSRSYNYLLNMPIYNISKDQYEKLQKEVEKAKEEIVKTEEITEAEMWLTDIKGIKC